MLLLFAKQELKLLIEKPAALYQQELQELYEKSIETKAKVYIAYNRRFFSSVMEESKIIKADGGITSLHFEFTEWADRIKELSKPKEVLNRWLLANSTHVIDLVFFLIGRPSNLETYVGGNEEWHPDGSIFVGMGKSEKNIPFSYHSNWSSVGRWGIEVLTEKRKLILRPMEKLKHVIKNIVVEQEIEIDDSVDMEYKTGALSTGWCFSAGW